MDDRFNMNESVGIAAKEEIASGHYAVYPRRLRPQDAFKLDLAGHRYR